METWMFPILTVLYPDLARVAAQYRIDRLSASLTNAINMGYEGAMWSWESALTGLWTAPWREADLYENHISADIPLALRKFYYASGDKQFLGSIWPMLNETCRFWACRFTRVDSTGPAGPIGYAANCSAKDGIGNWTLKNVIPPDESSGVSNDEAYTNAAGALTLSWCLEAANDLGIPLSSLPQIWSNIASSPFLPLNNSLYSEGPVHLQQTGYNGHTINQADVALLQFPLGLDFGDEQNQRDLDFYSSKTDFAGMFTGDSAYSVAYLALGNRTAADAQLQLAFNHIEPHFLVFHETAFDDGHTQHFITGNGGYLQGFVFGYSGMRIARVGVLTFSSVQPILPPLGVTNVKLRGVHLLTSSFDVEWNDVQVCFSLRLNGAAIELRVPNQASTPITSTAVCIPSQSFEVAGVGYI
jgi:trehalose/maltose hydrolase-like predicted phosphorylase